ncbi:MAG: orotidine-5'-phosphate decarboxylase [Eubacteriales bacterium]
MSIAFEKLSAAIAEKCNPTVMGLDPLLEYVPEFIREGKTTADAIFEFNKGLIDAVCDLVPAVKPQSAYYEKYGAQGLDALRRTIAYAESCGMYVILDAKRGDIGSTASAYADAYLGEGSGIDCMTVNGYLGSDGVQPFLDTARKNGRSIFVLVKTSNPSSSEFQDIMFGEKPLYRIVGEHVESWGAANIGADGYSDCGAVVGATHPSQLRELRAALPHTFFLVPGYGAQGGRAEDVALGFDNNGGGAVINSSRALMCAYKKHDDAQNYKKYTRDAVCAMRDEINAALKNL